MSATASPLVRFDKAALAVSIQTFILNVVSNHFWYFYCYFHGRYSPEEILPLGAFWKLISSNLFDSLLSRIVRNNCYTHRAHFEAVKSPSD